ncbi:hypothetical protein LTR56_021670 [Elasticomyces elasticus]|nr:hypothetical protein LTR56_021670 [Elasticomyces elasticus]KAK3664827.1 hypothetical protein LTR22_004417 [Elasticomyces elasticus]KAK4928636.1 hypothetical protein LTR49_004759 [Elasticomyces elasticus]KAK5765206.1 hypothetical protein LTS12_004720 [Elasticomyces elasticus]
MARSTPGPSVLAIGHPRQDSSLSHTTRGYAEHLTLGVTSTNTLPATRSLALKYADYCELIVEYLDLLGGPADDLYIRKLTFTAPDRHYRERRRPSDSG